MAKRIIITVLAVVLLMAGVVYYQVNARLVRLTPEFIAELQATVAMENEAAITNPAPQPAIQHPANPLRNVYFGDLHVHTAWSFDANLAGTRFDPDSAYAFARGAPLRLMSGELARLSVPLDFAAVTDHAESFGLFEGCADPQITPAQREFCGLFDTPSLTAFMQLRNQAISRPPVRMDFCGADGAFCLKHGKTTWQKTRQAADRAYEPGIFTTFYGYEYSPIWPKRGSTHRNVIFRNRTVPDAVVSAFEAATARDLWRTLEQTCVGECAFLTIPHNLNRYYGKAFSMVDEDGHAYTQTDWVRRSKYEPVVEIFQAKGSSECALGVSTADEECNFEQFFALCADGEHEACAGPGSYARDGLKFGLSVENGLGLNPVRNGFIGSTDTHNATPGDVEEGDYRGKSGVSDASARKRLQRRKFGPAVPITHNPGGLAAVWAEENTRDALFNALLRKETYATSGPRIRLRFFAGWHLPGDLLELENAVEIAYRQGVPMGGVLTAAGSQAPQFFMIAQQDPLSAGLHKIQIIKGWYENGLVKERVVDVACARGSPDKVSQRCPDLPPSVDLTTCAVDWTAGKPQLEVVWRDTDYQPSLSAFYYVRVLQAPTCRWSSYDAIRLNQAAVEVVPALIQERAWSSPIWLPVDKQPVFNGRLDHQPSALDDGVTVAIGTAPVAPGGRKTNQSPR